MVICPRCNGSPHGTALACGPGGSKWVPTTCTFCLGAATVSAERAEAWARRDAARTARIEGGESQRQAAARRGVSAAEYSQWENGQDI
jgi:hypothetical protein